MALANFFMCLVGSRKHLGIRQHAILFITLSSLLNTTSPPGKSVEANLLFPWLLSGFMGLGYQPSD